jgi:energy-coupling factor transporter ATP-binding protein EcfA2
MSILDQYKPKTLTEFLGNTTLIQSLDKLLREPPARALVVGPSGCGKTTLCNLVLLKHRETYDVLDVKCQDVDDIKALKSLIDNFVAHKTIESFFSKKAKLVFLDDIDVMMCSDRGCGTYLMSFVADAVKSGSKVSFVMTCSLSEERKLTDLKKKVPPLRMYNPSIKDTLAFVLDVIDKEGIECDPSKVVKLVEAFQGNVRSVLQNLHKLAFEDEALATERSHRMLFDATTFDIAKKMLTQPFPVRDLSILSDNTLVPLLMYENLFAELFDNRLKPRSAAAHPKAMAVIMDTSIDAEVMERYMFKTMDWELYPHVTTVKCGYINQFLPKFERKKYPKSETLVFTQVLTKAATRHNYGKRLDAIADQLGIYDVLSLFKAFDAGAGDDESALGAYATQIRNKVPEKSAAKRVSRSRKKTA